MFEKDPKIGDLVEYDHLDCWFLGVVIETYSRSSYSRPYRDRVTQWLVYILNVSDSFGWKCGSIGRIAKFSLVERYWKIVK